MRDTAPRWLAVALVLVACGKAALGGHGDGGADAPSICGLEPKGAFTFHVHNAGASPVIVDLGCGRTLPIVLATPQGRLPIGPGSVDVCEFTCDQVYELQNAPGACSDCGGGISRMLAPGATTDITWDRRVYSRRAVAPPCSFAMGACAFGSAVAPAAAQLGVLTTCPPDQHPTFSCAAPVATEFTVDTTGDAATIDVGP